MYLRHRKWRHRRAEVGSTYMVETIMVGINRRGIKSKMRRESNHAVGLHKRLDIKDQRKAQLVVLIISARSLA